MIIGRVIPPEEFKGKRADVTESLSRARLAPDGFSDHVFKIEHGVELGARVWPAPDNTTNDREPRPFVTWTHGGAFVGGNHFAPLSWLIPGFHALGYHVVSNAYRLCPQVDLEAGIEDCVDFIAWCRCELPGILGEDKVDVNRYVITGESGGGYMVTNMATRLPEPAPRAVVDVYGLVDLLDHRLFEQVDQSAYPAWGSDKDEPLQQEFSEERILSVIREGRNPAHAVSAALFAGSQVLEGEAQLTAAWKTPFPFTERVRLQVAVHSYLSSVWPLGGRHQSAFTALLHPERFTVSSDEDEKLKEKVRAFACTVSPMQILDTEPYVSGAKKYPPTAFLHGSAKIAVPLGQTERFAAKLRALGVETLVSVEPDEPHVFDQVYTDPSVPGWYDYIQPVIDFVARHVEK
ncbi:alpha/beta-hydrolase [Apiospora saccharicola]|uniref:Alpha/beta-hydrolase n=1 Tax=Apiospora saccharicola TaxID=335842 RepID=A0ABR1WLD7_9PEZI